MTVGVVLRNTGLIVNIARWLWIIKEIRQNNKSNIEEESAEDDVLTAMQTVEASESAKKEANKKYNICLIVVLVIQGLLLLIPTFLYLNKGEEDLRSILPR